MEKTFLYKKYEHKITAKLQERKEIYGNALRTQRLYG
jgi:hypothetical protein